MPVIVTTGEDDGTGRLRLTWEDVMRLKTKQDELEIENRRLVLTPEHIGDLCLKDQNFKNQYYDRATGTVNNQLGFELYDYAHNPFINRNTLGKLAFGGTVTADTVRASIGFDPLLAAKATGWTKMYFSESKNDPQNQRSLVSWRHYFIVMPTVETARCAIVSGKK